MPLPSTTAALFLLFAASISPPPASAFLPHPSPRAALRPDQPPISSTSLSAGRAPRGVPTLEEWTMMRDGGVKGRVFGHPDAGIEDMDIISTSAIEKSGGVDFGMCDGGVVVRTGSGSKYYLGAPSAAMLKKRPKVAPAPKSKSKPVKSRSKPVREAAPKREKEPAATAVDSGPELLPLSGKVVGGAKSKRRYLIVVQGKKMFQRSPSGKSTICNAYAAGRDGVTPSGPLLTLKVSSNIDTITREASNYDKITGGLFGGQFVSKIDFVTDPGGDFLGKNVIVMETGAADLKQLLSDRGGGGLRGRAMRDAASAACACLQAVHSSGMVWTDLKAENFVTTDDSRTVTDDRLGLRGMRGIDLESAIRRGGNPVDYSPEACPPEFAKMFVAGDGADFVLKTSYDMWSLGMLLYELSVGKGYFEGKSPSQTTKLLALEGFKVNTEAVEDKKLRDLINSLLRPKPQGRPGISQVLLSPFFTTTGIGSFSF